MGLHLCVALSSGRLTTQTTEITLRFTGLVLERIHNLLCRSIGSDLVNMCPDMRTCKWPPPQELMWRSHVHHIHAPNGMKLYEKNHSTTAQTSSLQQNHETQKEVTFWGRQNSRKDSELCLLNKRCNECKCNLATMFSTQHGDSNIS